jgi:lipid-binding SYLF domain-containing protein
MMLRRPMLAAAGAFLALTLANAPARADSDDQATVDHATGTLQDLRRDKEFGNARDLLHRARAVLIAPRIFKAGFFFGGEGGSAVLLARTPRGWSDPAFYTIASASFGLQIGAQESEMIVLVMSDKALHALMRNKVKLGANAGIAVVTLGSTAEGATTSNVGADLVVWASASGAYAGISLDGSVIEPSGDANASYYGRAVTPGDIVFKQAVRSKAASGLVKTLGSL